MTDGPSSPPPGWYPEGGRQRYWDGEAWTSQFWDVGAEAKKSFWTTGRIVAAVGATVLVLVVGAVGVFFALGSAGVFDPPPPSKAEAIDMCKDFADDDLKYPEEGKLTNAVAKQVRDGDYLVRGDYTLRGGSGPLRCEVEIDEKGEGWYLDALRMPEENAGPNQSKKMDVTDD